jgi:DNA adenine methylase
MRYNGGKSACAKQLSVMFNAYNPSTYWEPFVGAGSVISLVKCARRYGSDIEENMVALLKMCRDGYQFPSEVARERYYELKGSTPTNDEEAALKAFAGYGCSFAGSWQGSYAQNSKKDNYAAQASNSLRKMTPLLAGVRFSCAHYDSIAIPGDDVLVYCDPPYAGTRRSGVKGAFDSVTFWYWVRDNKNMVVVTEYHAPDDFVAVWKRPMTDRLKRKDGVLNVETLFAHESKVDYFRERAKITTL